MAEKTGVSPALPASDAHTRHRVGVCVCKQWKWDAVRGLGEIIPFPLQLFELPKQHKADA